ncbi:MAG: AAA family ATPase [Cyclobacteriaceae bacterium]|jgi:HTH-type transcriptional repressor of NAD biosynthesis genes|nr:ATP-binding protein [Flammeovirgaceae bacterium]
MMDGIKIVCFYGPESTGKSTLAARLASEFRTEWVPEVARELVTSNAFSVDEILQIGRAQTARVFEKLKRANRLLICDTDLITTQIYSRHYLGQVPEELVRLEQQVRYDHYFLFDVDVPWIADGLRDQGSRPQRANMLHLFERELNSRGISFDRVTGSYEQREEFVRRVLKQLLATP